MTWQEVKLPLNGTLGVMKGDVSFMILSMELEQLCLKVNCGNSSPFKFWHNFVKPITWDGRDSFPPKGSQPFSLYKPLASLASYQRDNHARIVVNERARSASGKYKELCVSYVYQIACQSVAICYHLKTTRVVDTISICKVLLTLLVKSCILLV